MATDPALPPSLSAELAEMKREIRALQVANRMLSSSITNGQFAVYDDEGRRTAQIGLYTDYADRATTGIHLTAPALADEAPSGATTPTDGTTVLEANDLDGFVLPTLSTPWRWQWVDTVTAPMAKHTTPGDWFDYLDAKVVRCNARCMSTELFIAGSASTTWEIRFFAQMGSESGTSDSYSITDATGHSLRFEWESSVFHPGYGTLYVSIQLRRTAGTGSATLYFPESLQWRPHEGGISSGLWTSTGTFTP